MTLSTEEYSKRVNHILAARLLRRIGAEEIPGIPKTPEEYSEAFRVMLFQYLKRKFVGCRIRGSTETYSIRLDSDIHRKSKVLRETILSTPKWKKWFEDNHSEIINTITRNNNPFSPGGFIQQKTLKNEEDGSQSDFLVIPYLPEKVHQFMSEGLIDLLAFLEVEYEKNVRTSNLYDRTVELIRVEDQRRSQARIARIERERVSYIDGLQQRLMPTIRPSQVDRSSRSAEDKFLVKMYDYCVANGISPSYAVEPTMEILFPVGMGLRVIAPPSEDEKNWCAVPMFDGYQIPEGYVLKERWGNVTGHDFTSPRSFNGTQPIVIENYVYLEYRPELWAHTVPASHADLLAVSKRLRVEAEAEAAEAQRIWEEQEKARRQRELEERLQREAERKRIEEEERQRIAARLEEAMKIAREEIILEGPAPEEEKQEFDEASRARMAAAADKLRAQMNKKGDEVLSQLSALKHEHGVYLNKRGIPTERYVAVDEIGGKKFFRESDDALNFMIDDLGYDPEDVTEIRDYWNPTEVVETF